MVVVEIIGAVLIVLLGLVIFSQVIIPAARGQLLFPYFRKSAELDAKLLELEQMKDDLEKVEQIQQAATEITKQQTDISTKE